MTSPNRFENYLRPPEGVDPRHTAEKLARIFREGLNDMAVLPEIESDAAIFTHQLLGCIWHSSMMVFVEAADRMPNDFPAQVRRTVNELIDRQLHRLARQVINSGGKPLGPNDRCGGYPQ